MQLKHLVYLTALVGILCLAGCGTKAKLVLEYDRGFSDGYEMVEDDCQAMKESCIKSIGAYEEVIRAKNARLENINQSHQEQYNAELYDELKTKAPCITKGCR